MRKTQEKTEEYPMKATYHNGRASKGGKVYNANHNTLAETRNQQRHIDHELTMENKIFQDCKTLLMNLTNNV